MNPRYIDTYRQHRALYLVPLLIGMVMALWFNLGSPKLYRSSTSLWSDTAGGSANDASGAPPPATQEQTMLNELLLTQYFPRRIAQKSPLEAYLKSHPSDGWGPGALLAKLRGPATLEDRVATALSPKRVTSLVLGPHVLKISYDGPSPTVSYETLRALVREFEKQRDALRADAITSYKDAITAASQALAKARADVSTYIREHPGVSQTDPQMRALLHSERNALDQLTGATEGLNQAANSALGNSQATLRVVDPPEVPMAAYGRHKRFVFAIFAGMFVGALISAIVIFALTKTGKTAAYADVEVVRRDEVDARRETQTRGLDDSAAVADAAASHRVHARRRKPPG
jgi:hypothetical protein